MAKKGKGAKNNNVRCFLFYYPSTLKSRNACPRTSMANVPIDRSERKAGPACPISIGAYSKEGTCLLTFLAGRRKGICPLTF
jgi:hypothetical protein